MRFALEWAAVMVVLLSGCGAAPAVAPEPSACASQTPLTWNNFGAPYFRSWCTGCHSSKLSADGRAGAPVGMDFDSRSSVLDHQDRIKARALAPTATMPPRGQPGASEKALLAEWLDCGAP